MMLSLDLLFAQIIALQQCKRAPIMESLRGNLCRPTELSPPEFLCLATTVLCHC